MSKGICIGGVLTPIKLVKKRKIVRHLNEAEIAVCRNLGITQEDYVVARAKRTAVMAARERRGSFGLTAGQTAICRNMGVNPVYFAAAMHLPGGIFSSQTWPAEAMDAAVETLRQSGAIDGDEDLEDLLEMISNALDGYKDDPTGADARQYLAQAAGLLKEALTKFSQQNADAPQETYQQLMERHSGRR